MGRFIIQPGVTDTILDFTRIFSPSLFSLVSLLLLVVTMSAVIAQRRYELEKRHPALHEDSFADQRKAA
jgi:hypothetical protein